MPNKFYKYKSVLKSVLALAAASLIALPQVSVATNGMNLAGYGPIATGMGGASMAYDNGTAAMMNNPATLGLMEDGADEFEIGIGTLGPNITTSMTGMPDADSSANLFLMPAVGWARKRGQITYGVGVFSQGGMGTEYKADSFLAAGSNEKVRSEVGVGRLTVPLTYEVDSNLNIGGSVDFVWAGMDMKMAMSGGQFMDMVAAAGGSQAYGTADGSLVQGLGAAIMLGADGIPFNGDESLAGVNWARYDFSDGSDFTGEAGGTGFGGKLGAVYKINDMVTIGGSYHSKTSISDLKTSNADLSMNVIQSNNGFGVAGPCGADNASCTINLSGKLKVVDFQWPETIAFGGAFQISDEVLVVADYKRIRWSEVMDDFQMIFDADATQTDQNAQFFVNNGASSVDATLFQDWEDQNVFQIGAAWQVMKPLTIRGGLNIANNPVPDDYVHPLFPAIVKNHVTLGGTYNVTDASSINLALIYAPPVTVEATHPTTGAKTGMEVSHSQFSSQLIYTYAF